MCLVGEGSEGKVMGESRYGLAFIVFLRRKRRGESFLACWESTLGFTRISCTLNYNFTFL